MAIRFHLDENVSAAVATALRRRGIDVTTPAEVGLIGADDSDHLRFAFSQARVVVTHDDDFTRIHADGAVHGGIFYCHKDKYSIGDLVRLLLLPASALLKTKCVGISNIFSRLDSASVAACDKNIL